MGTSSLCRQIAASGAILLALAACSSERWCDTRTFWYNYDYRYPYIPPEGAAEPALEREAREAFAAADPNYRPPPRAYYVTPPPYPSSPHAPSTAFGSCDSEDLINFSCK